MELKAVYVVGGKRLTADEIPKVQLTSVALERALQRINRQIRVEQRKNK